MNAGHSLVGRVLDDRYRIVAEVGRGGHGTVYRAVHLQLERDVAIKVIMAPSEGVERRFRREAQAQARLRHPAVVKLLDFGVDTDGRPYMVQEFVDGESLRDRLKRGPVPPDEAVTLMGDVLDALSEAHALGIVHRDVKPSNIMVARGPRRTEARLLDFGVVKLLDPAAHTRLTRAGVLVGTPGYMAPEQMRFDQVTPATDIYSAGVVLFQMLGGRRPYAGASVKEMLRAQLHGQPRALPEHVPPPLARVALTAMAREPAARFEGADAMHAALRAARDLAPGSGPPARRSSGSMAAVGPPSYPTADSQPGPSTPLRPSISAPFTDAPLPFAAPPPTAPLTGPARKAPLALIALLALSLALLTAATVIWMTDRGDEADEGPVLRLRAGSLPPAAQADPPGSSAPAVEAPPEPDAAPPEPDAAPPEPDAEPPRPARPPPRARAQRPARPAPAPPPDAAPPPTDAPVDRAAELEARIDADFEACRCDAALRSIDALARLAPAAARARRSRHRRQCRLALPGSCVTRAATP